MQKKRHLAIEIVPGSQQDTGMTDAQFATLSVELLIRQDNQSDIFKTGNPAVTIGAAHTPQGQDTPDAAIAMGAQRIDAIEILSGLLQVIVDYIEQIEP